MPGVEKLRETGVIIDAMFGIGKQEPPGNALKAVELINNSGPVARPTLPAASRRIQAGFWETPLGDPHGNSDG